MSTIWYLWPRDNDPRSNEHFVQIVGEQNTENECRDKTCADGVSRNLFRCPKGYADVQTAIAAMSRFDLKFEVFKQDSAGAGAEKVVRYDLWKKEVRRAARSGRLRSRRR